MKTPSVWMEARCGSVSSDMGPNWQRPSRCHQTIDGGGFYSDIRRARKDFLAQGWKIIEDEWFCPVCAKLLLNK